MFNAWKVLLLVCIDAGKPGISSGLPTINATFGSQVTLDCNIASNDSVTEVFWERSTENGNMTFSPDIIGISGSTRSNPSLTILVASTVDAGLYSCYIRTNNKPKHINTTILRIEGATPDVKVRFTSVSGIYGTPITLYVDINATPLAFHIYWKRQNEYGEIITINDRSTGYEGGNISAPSLTISYPKFNDKGIYTCYARNSFGLGYSHKIYMIVEGGVPEVSVHALNYSVPFGDRVALNCTVNAIPAHLNVFWHRKKNNAITTITQDTEGVLGSTNSIPTLTIQYVTTSDTGSYTCFSENIVGVGSSLTMLLTVTGGRPLVEVKSILYSTMFGSPVTLHCDIKGDPKFTTVYWQKKSNVGLWSTITSGAVGIQGINVTQPSLTIVFPVQSDAGEYICIAVNAVGSSGSLPTFLSVMGEKPIVTVKSNSYSAHYGNEHTLYCSVTASPVHVDVYWEFEKNGDVRRITSETSGIRGVNKDNPSLTIPFVTISDDGYYTCFAVNIVGIGISRPVRLSVNAAIPFVSVFSSIYSVKEGSGLSLVCKIMSTPAHSHVYWQKEKNKHISILKEETTGILGVSIDDPSIYFNPVRRGDSGHYTCFAINAIGIGFSRVITLEVTPIVEEISTEKIVFIIQGDNNAFNYNIMYGVIGSVGAIAAIVSALGVWKCKTSKEGKRDNKCSKMSLVKCCSIFRIKEAMCCKTCVSWVKESRCCTCNQVSRRRGSDDLEMNKFDRTYDMDSDAPYRNPMYDNRAYPRPMLAAYPYSWGSDPDDHDPYAPYMAQKQIRGFESDEDYYQPRVTPKYSPRRQTHEWHAAAQT